MLGFSIKSFTISIDQSFPSLTALRNEKNGKINLKWINTGYIPLGEFYSYYIIQKNIIL